MDTEISFFVPGVPIPQGSKNAGIRNGQAYMWEANKKHLPWRETVTHTARKHLGAFSKDTPVEVHAIFVFDRPKSVKPTKRAHMSVKPDLESSFALSATPSVKPRSGTTTHE